MADTNRPGGEHLARMARQHLDSLRAAGVEWLPVAPPGPSAMDPSPNPSIPGQTSSLYAEEALAGQQAPQETPTMAGAQGSPALSLQKCRQELEVLTGTVARCTRCAELAATRTQTVFGVGAINPDLCFIGEAPGADEDAQGEPFVGAAGQLLNRIIAACGMKREEVYICNVIKCRPPGNRTPLPDEAANCREYLEKQLALVRPRFICALGSTAAHHLLGTTLSIGKLRGRFHDFRGIPVLCTYHPAYLLPHRNPDKKKDVWEDMKMLLARMGRPVPRKPDSR